MKRIASIITGLALFAPLAASAAMTPIERFESKLKIASVWDRPENKALLEQRLKLSHTNQENGQFYERSYNANLVELGKYVNQYRCFTGDTAACRVQAAD